MATQAQETQKKPEFPANWRITADYDPNEHLINLKGKEYLNVQNRMLWFLRDQRAFTVAGLAQVPYIVRTELVEMDRAEGFAHFKTYVRDVLGNEATMYGSESVRDFGDYAEKASTKSLGRALLALGYGTAFAPEMDEEERVVDSPVERTRPPASQRETADMENGPVAAREDIPAASKSVPAATRGAASSKERRVNVSQAIQAAKARAASLGVTGKQWEEVFMQCGSKCPGDSLAMLDMLNGRLNAIEQKQEVTAA